jgi:hypothetical protein
MKIIGRRDFALCLLFVTALGSIFEFALRENARANYFDIPRDLQILLQSGIFCLVGMYAAKAIDGRLADAGLSRLYRYPAFAVWLLATSLPFVKTREWPIALVLFLILLTAGAVAPGEHSPTKQIGFDKTAQDEKVVASQFTLPPRLLIGPVSFLRSLLTFACLGFPLIFLEDTLGRGIGTAIVYIGYGVLYFVWLVKVLGRFADSGRSSNIYWFPFCIASTAVSALPLRFHLLNRYETLALFLLIQVPLAFLPSQPREERHDHLRETRRANQPTREDKKSLMIDRFTFLRVFLVVAALWALLIYVEGTSTSGTSVWFSRSGYFVLACVWIMIATGRFTDADWDHGWRALQYCLVVAVVSLMPLAVHWVNGYGSLSIFCLMQIPAALLPSKPVEKQSSPYAKPSDAS